MKFILFTISFLFSLQLYGIDISVVNAVYYMGDKSPYVEIHYRVSGKSLKQENKGENLSSSIKILMTLEINKEIQQYDHYRLNTDLETPNEDIIDIRRYNVEEGKYLLKIEVTDLLDTTSIYYHTDSIIVRSLKDQPYISNLVLLSDVDAMNAEQAKQDTRTKYNFFLKILPHQFAYKNIQKIFYYTELYNMPRDTEDGFFYLRAELKEAKIGQRAGAILYSNVRKKKAKDLDVYLNTLDLTGIPSGNYILELKAELQDGSLLTSTHIFFQRSNPEFDQKLLMESEPDIVDAGDLKQFESLPNDTLVYSLKAITPLVRQVDSDLIKLLVRDRDKKAMSRYLSNYFKDEYPAAPFLAYKQFMVIARFTDQFYNNGFLHGFETDRGRVFIRYGRPSDIVTVEDEVSAPPYEIWVYNEWTENNQTNVKFLFYNPDLIHNGHVLLHSTARGEINNVQWQSILYKNAPGEGQKQTNFFEGQNAQDAINRRAVRYFTDL